MRPLDVRRGMVAVGPIPVMACFAPYRFTGRCLQTGRTTTVVVSQSRAAEVLDLAVRVLEFVRRQDGELLLWDGEAGQMFSVPESQASWLDGLATNSPVLVPFNGGEPVWAWGPVHEGGR